MRRWRSEDVVLWASVAMAAVIVFAVLFGGVIHATTRRACLQAGYPRHDVDWTLGRYCVKRVDQTDVVVPLSKVQP